MSVRGIISAMATRPTPRGRTLVRRLQERRSLAATDRAGFDQEVFGELGRPRAVVFTDTAHFTLYSVRYGILHFMMSFQEACERVAPVIAPGGEIVKIEGDSLMLRYDSVVAACRGVARIEAALRRFNRGRPEDQLMRFSYGIGWGHVLDLEHDLFGLEVNLASKLGEDLARPGEVLLTPSAVEALPSSWRARLVRYPSFRLLDRIIPVRKLKLA